jgi:competence protein ComEA
VGWWLLRPTPPPVELGMPRIGSVTTAPSPPVPLVPTSSAPAVVVIHVAGAVAAPGVYRLPAGARVADAITAARGTTTDAAPHALALAAPVADGQRIVVPTAAEVVPTSFALAPPPPTGDPSGPPSPAEPLDLNAATAAQLDSLPGVGPATAAAIVEHRERDGPFASVDALLDVRGIGPAKLEAIRPLVRVA